MQERRIRYLEGSEVRATRPEGAVHLRIEILGDQVLLSSRIKRVFPLSSSGRLFSLQTSDEKEVAILRSLEGCDAQTEALIREELDRRYFSPQILRILDIKIVPGMWSFDVETNRGAIEFYVRNWRDNSQEIEPNRWHITSVDGQRFEIKDIDALDRKSQSLLEQLL